MTKTARTLIVLVFATLSTVSLASPNTGPTAPAPGGGTKQQACQWVTTTMPKVTGWDKYGFPMITMVTTQIWVCRPA